MRIGFGGIAGHVSEPDARDSAPFAGGNLSVHVLPFAGLDLGLALDVLSYGRDYVTTLPDAGGQPAGLRVHTGERLVRGRFTAGYECVHLFAHGDAVAFTPYLLVDSTSFVSGAFPQRPLSLGFGATLDTRIADGLHVVVGFDYAKVVHSTDPNVRTLLYFGSLAGTFRFDAGVSIHPSENVRLDIRYRGEAQIYQHDARLLHAVLVGPNLSFR